MEDFQPINPFDWQLTPNTEQHFFEPFHIKPVDERLKENRERRMIIENEKEKEKQMIRQKRKQRDANADRLLREKR
jgi:hypothetical protein